MFGCSGGTVTGQPPGSGLVFQHSETPNPRFDNQLCKGPVCRCLLPAHGSLQVKLPEHFCLSLELFHTHHHQQIFTEERLHQLCYVIQDLDSGAA